MPPETAALVQWQRAFADALREAAIESRPALCLQALQGIAAADRIGVYRNNAQQAFRSALALTYPVLKRRVGDDYFRQLAHEYRIAHPSPSGDLHFSGAAFPGWLRVRLAGTEYAWLADLARLEWACEEAAAAAALPAIPLVTLGSMSPAALEYASVHLQPSLRLVASPFPVWSVWQANQGESPATGIERGGPEHCACACTTDRVAVYRLAAEDYALLEALQQGAVFGAALATTGADAGTLARVLDWAFAEGLVVALNPTVRA